MSEAPATTDTATGDAIPAQGEPIPEAPVKPETDWKAEAKKWETRAKENKTAADRLAEIEEANKTEAQKASDRLKAAEREAASARREASMYKIAAEFKLSGDDAAALEHVATEDGMRLIAQRLAGVEVERKKQGNQVPREGTTTSSADSDERAVARSLFGG